MGTIILELTNNLVIFRPEDEDTTDKDTLFYIYEKIPYEIGQDISLEELEKIGKNIVNMKELDTNVVRKAASIVTPIVREKDKGTVTGYEIFGFLLLIKISIDMILSYVYAKGFTKLSKEIVESESSIAYKLGQYFLNELNYAIGFSKDAIDILYNEQYFKELYEIILRELEKGKDIEKVYLNFMNEVKNVKA